jgi:hypothetical protein
VTLVSIYKAQLVFLLAQLAVMQVNRVSISYLNSILTLKGRIVVNLLKFLIVFFGQFLYKFYNKKLKISKFFLL